MPEVDAGLPTSLGFIASLDSIRNIDRVASPALGVKRSLEHQMVFNTEDMRGLLHLLKPRRNPERLQLGQRDLCHLCWSAQARKEYRLCRQS